MARARIRGARAARAGATLDFVPTVTAIGGYTRQRIASASFPIGGGGFPDQDIWDAGFDASWEIDLFGRDPPRGARARGAGGCGGSRSCATYGSRSSAELARVYFELRGAQEQLAVAQRNAENQRRTLELTRERLDAGRGTAFDTERAQAQLSITLASVPALEARVAAAQYRIGVLAGRPPAEVGPRAADRRRDAGASGHGRGRQTRTRRSGAAPTSRRPSGESRPSTPSSVRPRPSTCPG